jgi:hypothetical protein
MQLCDNASFNPYFEVIETPNADCLQEVNAEMVNGRVGKWDVA